MSDASEIEQTAKASGAGDILSVNKRSYHGPGFRDAAYMVVLVCGHVGDYAAYAGIWLGWSSSGTSGESEVEATNRIARGGDKISFEEACVHFPGGQLERERYRR